MILMPPADDMPVDGDQLIAGLKRARELQAEAAMLFSQTLAAKNYAWAMRHARQRDFWGQCIERLVAEVEARTRP